MRSGLPDVLVLFRHDTGIMVAFVELKSRRGVASKAQKQLRLQNAAGRGCVADGAKRPRCDDGSASVGGGVPSRMGAAATPTIEGPFPDPTQRLPQHPKVAAERRESKRRYRAAERNPREREAALAQEGSLTNSNQWAMGRDIQVERTVRQLTA